MKRVHKTSLLESITNFTAFITTATLLTAAVGSANAQSFGLDDNPTTPLIDIPGVGFGAEDPFGLFTNALAPNGFYISAFSSHHNDTSGLIQFEFSVDRWTTGTASNLATQASRGQAPTDIFLSNSQFISPGLFAGTLTPGPYSGPLDAFIAGPQTNILLFGDSGFGLKTSGGVVSSGIIVSPPSASPPGTFDNIDSWDKNIFDPNGDTLFNIDTYFTLYNAEAPGVPSLTPADIIVVAAGDSGASQAPYANYLSLGLTPQDNIDALVMFDNNLKPIPLGSLGTPGQIEPVTDYALFSLAPGSASLATFSLNAGDIFFTDFTGNFALYATANELGIRSNPKGSSGFSGADNLDAMEIQQGQVPTGACCIPGAPCSELTAIDCIAAGGTYQGDFSTCATNPCPGDDCSSAIPIFDGTTNYNMAAATNDGFTGPCFTSSLPNQWFQYTALGTGNLTVTACDTASFNGIEIWNSCAVCPPVDGDLLACESGNTVNTACFITSEFTVPVTAGQCYLIRLTTFDTTQTGTINITFTKPGNTCSDAQPIADGTTPYDMTGSTPSGPITCIANIVPSIWFNYTATVTGSATIEACDFVNSNALDIWRGCACPPIGGFDGPIACRSDNGSDPSCISSTLVIFPIVAGECYLIRLTTFDDTQSGDITITSTACGLNNPSFETGDFTGWTTQDLTSPFGALRVDPSSGFNPAGFGFLWGTAATDGNFTAYTGIDGNGATSGFPISIAQVVTIVHPGLHFDWRAAWNITFRGATLDRTFDVVIRPPGGGPEIGRIPVIHAKAQTIVLDSGQHSTTVDVSPFLGQTVQLSFEWTIPEDFTGPGHFQLDNICLGDAPTCPADLTTTNTNPGDSGYAIPDGFANGADLSFFVEFWFNARGSIADVTTTNTNLGNPGYGVPDGFVNGADISFFVEQWLNNCP